MDILAVRGNERRLLASDMLPGAGKYALIRRFLNGGNPATGNGSHGVLSKVGTLKRTQGTETSKYLKEE